MFHLVQCFKTFSLYHTQKTFCIFIHTSLLLLYIHMLTAFNACLQPSSGTYITPTLQYYLYLAHISRLWPRNGACIFYSVMVAYVLMLKLDVVDFVNVVIRFESLRFWFEKVIDVFLKKLKKKKHSNWLFIKLVILYIFMLELILCRFLWTFFYYYFVWYEAQ